MLDEMSAQHSKQTEMYKTLMRKLVDKDNQHETLETQLRVAEALLRDRDDELNKLGEELVISKMELGVLCESKDAEISELRKTVLLYESSLGDSTPKRISNLTLSSTVGILTDMQLHFNEKDVDSPEVKPAPHCNMQSLQGAATNGFTLQTGQEFDSRSNINKTHAAEDINIPNLASSSRSLGSGIPTPTIGKANSQEVLNLNVLVAHPSQETFKMVEPSPPPEVRPAAAAAVAPGGIVIKVYEPGTVPAAHKSCQTIDLELNQLRRKSERMDAIQLRQVMDYINLSQKHKESSASSNNISVSKDEEDSTGRVIKACGKSRCLKVLKRIESRISEENDDEFDFSRGSVNAEAGSKHSSKILPPAPILEPLAETDEKLESSPLLSPEKIATKRLPEPGLVIQISSVENEDKSSEKEKSVQLDSDTFHNPALDFTLKDNVTFINDNEGKLQNNKEAEQNQRLPVSEFFKGSHIPAICKSEIEDLEKDELRQVVEDVDSPSRKGHELSSQRNFPSNELASLDQQTTNFGYHSRESIQENSSPQNKYNSHQVKPQGTYFKLDHLPQKLVRTDGDKSYYKNINPSSRANTARGADRSTPPRSKKGGSPDKYASNLFTPPSLRDTPANSPINYYNFKKSEPPNSNDIFEMTQRIATSRSRERSSKPSPTRVYSRSPLRKPPEFPYASGRPGALVKRETKLLTTPKWH